MKKKFSIWVREHGSNHDVELMEIDSNPEEMKKACYAKTLKVGKRRTAKYTHVRIVENR